MYTVEDNIFYNSAELKCVEYYIPDASVHTNANYNLFHWSDALNISEEHKCMQKSVYLFIFLNLLCCLLKGILSVYYIH